MKQKLDLLLRFLQIKVTWTFFFQLGVNIFHRSGKHDRVSSLQIMDKLNLSVYVEQVNHETDSTIVDKWEESEELALNNVIDPNTEFKVILYFSIFL